MCIHRFNLGRGLKAASSLSFDDPPIYAPHLDPPPGTRSRAPSASVSRPSRVRLASFERCTRSIPSTRQISNSGARSVPRRAHVRRARGERLAIVRSVRCVAFAGTRATSTATTTTTTTRASSRRPPRARPRHRRNARHRVRSTTTRFAIPPRARRCVEQGELLTSLINDEVHIGVAVRALVSLVQRTHGVDEFLQLGRDFLPTGIWILHHL